MEKILLLQGARNYMKEFTLESRILNVNNVGKHPIGPKPLENMKKLTVVRNPIFVSNVENILVLSVTPNT
jgi:hypothetical protein